MHAFDRDCNLIKRSSFNRIVDTSSKLGTPQHVKVFALHCIVFVKLTSNLHCKVCGDHKSWPLVLRWNIYFQFYDISLSGLRGCWGFESLFLVPLISYVWSLYDKDMFDPVMSEISGGIRVGDVSTKGANALQSGLLNWWGPVSFLPPSKEAPNLKCEFKTLIFLDSHGIWMFCVAPGRKNLCSVLR